MTESQVDAALEPILKAYWVRHHAIDCTDHKLQVASKGKDVFADLDWEFHRKCADAGLDAVDRLHHAQRAYARGCADPRYGDPVAKRLERKKAREGGKTAQSQYDWHKAERAKRLAKRS